MKHVITIEIDDDYDDLDEIKQLLDENAFLYDVKTLA